MKFIRWVEVHIGRSRRKNGNKKDKDSSSTKEEGTPLHKVDPLGRDVPRSAGATPRKQHPPSPHPSLHRAAPEPFHPHPRLQIRTSLLENQSPQHLGGSATALDSPRVRCRIRTNPWLPSPRVNRHPDPGWPPSVGSESSESIAGSGFGSQSSGSLWEGYCSSTGEAWPSYRGLGGRSPALRRLPRVTLERRPRAIAESPCKYDDEDTPYCPATYCRPIPRSAWMDFRELAVQSPDIRKTSTRQDDGDSSDEAYSEDYVHVEEEEDRSGRTPVSEKCGPPPDTGSPQADSACGSDGSSCSTTPLSETKTPIRNSPPPDIAAATPDTLRDKVERLRLERARVDRRMQEARAEEILRREEHLLLQRELVQFRRLLLLQTLSELRNQLEDRGRQDRARQDASDDDSWLSTEIVG